MWRQLLAICVIGIRLASASEVLERRTWVDISVDEKGSVTEATAVGELQEVLAGHIESYVQAMSFEPAMINGAAAPSTTSVWVEFKLLKTATGWELQFLDYNAEPRPTERRAVRYPASAFRNGRQGWVKISFTVKSSGHVSDLNIVESSHREFEKAAVNSIRKWRFKPRTVNGQPIPTVVDRTIEFVLEDGT